MGLRGALMNEDGGLNEMAKYDKRREAEAEKPSQDTPAPLSRDPAENARGASRLVSFLRGNWRRLLMAALALVLVVSTLLIILRVIGYRRDNLTYSRISEQVPSVDPGSYFNQAENEAEPASPSPTAPDDHSRADASPTVTPPYAILPGNPVDIGESGILRDYEKLKGQNADLFGWVKVPGFRKPLSYPVMQTDNDEYYMNHDFYGNDSYAGSIFFDSRNDPSKVEHNFILYGHAMKDMAMFGFFSDYPDNAEALENVRLIYLDLLNVRLEYEIFSTYYAKPDEPYRQTWFPSNDDYLAFLNAIKERSLYDFGTGELTWHDRILTLSTCSDSLFQDGRTVIHARLKRMITYDGSASGEYAEPAMTGDASPVLANVYISTLEVHYLPVSEKGEQEDMAGGAGSGSAQGFTGSDSGNAPGSGDSETSPAPDPAGSNPGNAPGSGGSETSPVPSPGAGEPAQESSGGAPSASDKPSSAPQTLVACVLDPPFRTSHNEFRTSVPEEVETVILTIVASDPKARVELYIGDEKLQGYDVPLVTGENRIRIRVVSRDGQYARYTALIVTRGSIREQDTVNGKTPGQEPPVTETPPAPSETPYQEPSAPETPSE